MCHRYTQDRIRFAGERRVIAEPLVSRSGQASRDHTEPERVADGEICADGTLIDSRRGEWTAAQQCEIGASRAVECAEHTAQGDGSIIVHRDSVDLVVGAGTDIKGCVE